MEEWNVLQRSPANVSGSAGGFNERVGATRGKPLECNVELQRTSCCQGSQAHSRMDACWRQSCLCLWVLGTVPLCRAESGGGGSGGTSQGQGMEASVSAMFSVHMHRLSPFPGAVQLAAAPRAQSLAKRLGLTQYPRPLEASLTLPRSHSLPRTPGLSPPSPVPESSSHFVLLSDDLSCLPLRRQIHCKV